MTGDVARCPRCGSSMEGADRCAVCGLEPAVEEAGPRSILVETLLGRTLAGYVLDKVIGAGARGAVFRGRATAGEGAAVAVKVLLHDRRRSPVQDRLLAEARRAIGVRHPSLAALLAVDADPALGVAWLVSEFVEGEPLSKILDAGGVLPSDEAAMVGTQVADALGALHTVGALHRDVKPAHIAMRTPASVRLVEAGFAPITTAASGHGETARDPIVGTPAYMAPEQAKDVSCAWPESDLYSLGAVLFHLLTGRPPFVADSTVGVLVQHASRPAPPVRSLAPAIRPSLAHIVDRLLSKRPDQRPSARELAEALRCVLHEPRSAVFEASAPAKAAAGPAALSRTWLRHETELASVLARRSAEWGEGIEAALRSRRSMLERGRPLAEALLDLGLVPREVLDQAASEVRAAADRAFDEAFGRFVVEAGLAGSEEVQKALAGAARHSSSRAAPPSVSTPLARTRSPGGLPVRAAARTQTGAGDAELLSAGAADASVPLMVALVDAGTISCADAVAVEARCERHLREADTAVTCEVARSRGVPDEALTAARFELDDLSRGDDRSLLNLLVEAGVIAEETAWELAADQVRAVLSGTGQTR